MSQGPSCLNAMATNTEGGRSSVLKKPTRNLFLCVLQCINQSMLEMLSV